MIWDVRGAIVFFTSTKNWSNSWALLFPAVVYTVQNNLSFVALTYISAADFQLLSQCKTLCTAIFSVLFLSTKLSRIQWMALLLLVIGVALAQMDCFPSNNASRSSNQASDQFKGNPTCFIITFLGEFYTFISLYFCVHAGVCAVLLLSVLSGAAGVYQEKVLKKYIDLPIHFLNVQVPGYIFSFRLPYYSCFFNIVCSNAHVQLAFFSIFTNIISIYLQDTQAISSRGFFFGYTPVVFAIIVVGALGGLLVALVIRHTSNLAKSYARFICFE